MYKTLYFEISGGCNAKCPWCVTGNGSLGQCSPSFVKATDFERAVDILSKKQLIGPSTTIRLYNWGEPLLNPDFEKIIEVLHKRKLAFGVSTNASRVVKVNGNLMTYMDQMSISMPGFSQKSYDRIHGFDFERILENIDSLLNCYRTAGFNGYAGVSYHIYQFNIGEIRLAVKFCASRKIGFSPVVAFLNDFNLAKAYLHGTLSCEVLKEACKDLLLFYVDDIIKCRPSNYHCPQYEYLVIDEKFNVLTCCLVPKNHPDYFLGSLFDLSFDDIKAQKKSRAVCVECNNSGLSYWIHNAPLPSFVDDIIGRPLLNRIKRKVPVKLKLFAKYLISFKR
jgi:MoaA/NifB/PqqE/SkfB family radical SAM enzyme